MLKKTVLHTVSFNELDPMNVVWHGNYVNFFELARAALLNDIGLSYTTMAELGYVLPVVKLNCKYIRSARLGQTIAISAEIIEYRNSLNLKFVIRDHESGTILTKGETMQMAVCTSTGESSIVLPDAFISKIEAHLQKVQQ